MFGPRLGTVFASRWRALWFCGSVLLLAYCSVPSPDESAKQVTEKQAVAHPANPWSLQN